MWDYAPKGTNVCFNRAFNADEDTFVTADPVVGLQGSVYKKAQYVGYTDATFATKTVRPAAEEHLGLLGPAMYAAVGDTLKITFHNALAFDVNLRISTNNQHLLPGAFGIEPTAVAPGATVVYDWLLPAEAGPGPTDVSSQLWLYRSTVDLVADVYTGLLGPLVVTRAGAEDAATGKPAGVVNNIFSFFWVNNEGNSHYIDDNTPVPTSGVPIDPALFEESNLMHNINGYLYCNGPFPKVNIGETTRWYVATVGTEVDIHTPHWHGNVIQQGAVNRDEVESVPGTAMAVDMTVDDPGRWLYHCHVNDHLFAGMATMYDVADPNNLAVVPAGVNREYFVGVVEEPWDYVPCRENRCGSTPRPFTDAENYFVGGTVDGGPTRIGSVYLKARYVRFTDNTFTTRYPIPPEEEHVGIMGPVLRGEVGDTLVIYYKNMAKFDNSLHPHGVFYEKTSEGAPYHDGTTNQMDDMVAANGGTHTYLLHLPVRAGPTPAMGSSRMWMYHSHTDEIVDTYSGLTGMFVVYSPGMYDVANNRAADVDREFFIFKQVFDENNAWYLAENTAAYTPAGSTIVDQDDFDGANLMSSINGYMYCNMPVLTPKRCERVRWYLNALGTEADVHTVSWNGDVVNFAGLHQDTQVLLPSSMHTVDQVPLDTGSYVMHCQAHNHFDNGEQAKVTIMDNPGATCGADFTASTERVYYVAAETVLWNYVPSGMDMCKAAGFLDADQQVFTNTGIGSIYKKARYVAYTDATFTVRAPEDPHLGYLGPTFKAAVGDKIRVVFKNKLTHPVNIQPHGLRYDRAATAGPVLPGDVKTYQWFVEPTSGPGALEGSSKAWMYHSSIDRTSDTNAGLLGAIIIYDNADLVSAGVDREFVIASAVVNENLSPYLQDNIDMFFPANDLPPADFEESNLMHAINGRLYCNLYGLNAIQGERARFHFMAVGSQISFHGITFTDYSMLDDGHRTYAVELFPGFTRSLDMDLTHPSRSLVSCDLADHYLAGMKATFAVFGA